ncbi:MAG: hypothetical protein ABI333_08415, partial [bacterium]
ILHRSIVSSLSSMAWALPRVQVLCPVNTPGRGCQNCSGWDPLPIGEYPYVQASRNSRGELEFGNHDEAGSKRSYRPVKSPAELNAAASGIRAIGDIKERDSELEKAQEIIYSAKRVIFLGFGYDQTNIERLMGPDVAPGGFARGTKIYGTAVELSNRQASAVQSRLRKLAFDAEGYEVSVTIDNESKDCLPFLEKYEFFAPA